MVQDSGTLRLGSTDMEQLALAVAQRYYVDDQSKVEIGQALGISRFQVARLLQGARRDGLVRIEIGAVGRDDPDLASALAERLGLQRCVVVGAQPGSRNGTYDAVGVALAREMRRTIRAGTVVGLTWSRATAVMAMNLSDLEPCTVVQLAGAIYPPDGLPGSVEVARMVANAAGTTAHTLYAPLIVPDAETAAGLRRQPEIAATIEWTAHLDTVVLSVGGWSPMVSAVYSLLGPEERASLDGLGVCAEASGRLIDADGASVATDLDERVIGPTLDQLRAVPLRLTTSCGAYRRDPTLAAVRAGLVHTLIVDDDLARALLV